MSRDQEDRGRWAPPYEMNRSVRIPEAIPELGIVAGDTGCIDSVHTRDDGTLVLLVDRSGPELPHTSALIEIEVLTGEAGSTRVVGYSRLGA